MAGMILEALDVESERAHFFIFQFCLKALFQILWRCKSCSGSSSREVWHTLIFMVTLDDTFKCTLDGELLSFREPDLWQRARLIQGVQGLILILQSALTNRNMQVKFGLKVFLTTWNVDIYGNAKQIFLYQMVSEIWFFLFTSHVPFL